MSRARWVLVVALSFAAPSWANPPPKKPPTVEEISKQRAREAYSRGTKHYNIGDFKEALAAFKEAYLAYEDPTFLFNIAQCHRNLNQKLEAVRAYRAYLRTSPSSSSRAEVEGLIANLERAINEEQAATRRTPSGTIAPGETPGGNEPPSAQPVVETPPPAVPQPVAQPAPAATPTAAVVTATATPVEAKPTAVYKKWWLWTIVGVVVVGAGVGVGVGLALSSGTKYPSMDTTAGTFRF